MAILYAIATPIGNLEDLSIRAKRVLGEIDVLACEDTRHTRVLLERHGIVTPPTLIAYHEHNEIAAGKRLIGFLENGKNVGVVSNAGAPSISDPGYRIISDAIDAGHEVVFVPGPSAPIAALVLSGLPVASFTFKGFAPKKTGQRKNWFALDKDLPHTLIFFESPNRVADTLNDALEVLGDRKVAVCFELTKKFERVARGWLSEVVGTLGAEPQRGEITVCIAGNNKKFIRSTPI